MRRQTIVAVLTAACCGAVSCGDTFGTLTEPMCRLRSEFLPRALFVPSLGRNRAGGTAACKCASYTLAGKPAILEPTNARRAMLQSFVGGSFRERVESSCLSRTVRAHETALDLTMRKTSIGSKKISLSPTKSVMKPFVSEKPSHQVIAYQSCKFSCLNSSNLKRRAKNFSTRCSTGPRAQCLLRTTLNRFGDKASL
jgi:hypothetical protein